MLDEEVVDRRGHLKKCVLQTLNMNLRKHIWILRYEYKNTDDQDTNHDLHSPLILKALPGNNKIFEILTRSAS
jgi:hypothetical protein